MADYNVQMKQFNGTNFDNILPHAYLADTATVLAGGGGATEIIAQARAGLSQIATGSYVGNGNYGQNNPTVINCGFKPKVLMLYQAINTSGKYRYYSLNGGAYSTDKVDLTHEGFRMTSNGDFSNDEALVPAIFDFHLGTFLRYYTEGIRSPKVDSYMFTKFNLSDSGVSFYCDYVENAEKNSVSPRDRRDAKYQYNTSGATYYYIAFG